MPVGWSIIGESEHSLTIPANDSAVIPFRGTPSKSIKGEIGYSIVGALSTSSGKPLANTYCLVKVPKKEDLRFRTITRISYFDQKSKKADLSFRIENNGNVDELVNLNFKSSDQISLEGEVDNNYATDVSIPPLKDTTLTYEVTLHKSENGYLPGRSLYHIDLEGSTEDKTFRTTFWFKDLNNEFIHQIPSHEKPLIVTLSGQNLFSRYQPTFTGRLKGNILFRNDRNLNYYYVKYPSGNRGNILKYSRFYCNYESNNLQIKLGDNISIPTRFGGNRGVEIFSKVWDKISFGGLYSCAKFRDICNYGLSYDLNTKIPLRGSFIYTQNQFNKVNTALGNINTRFTVFDDHTFQMKLGVSEAFPYDENVSDKYGFGYRFQYYGNIKEGKLRIRNNFGTPFFYGTSYSRNYINGSFSYPLKNNDYLYINGLSHRQNPTTYLNGLYQTENFMINRKFQVKYRKYLTGNFSLITGPIYRHDKSNVFTLYSDNNSFFETHTPKLRIGGSYRDQNRNSIQSSIVGGYTFVTHYKDNSKFITQNKQFFNAYFRFSYRHDNWGVYFSYNHGPYSINQQHSYFYSDYYSKSLRAMPYYEKYLYKDVLKFSTKLNYLNNLTSKTQRLYLANELTGYFKY